MPTQITKLQKEIVQEMGVKPVIDPIEEVETRATFLATYAKKAGANGFVLGISGGVDSCLAGIISQKATEKLRAEGINARFIAMRLPYGTQKDEDAAQRSLELIKPDEIRTFDIEKAVDGANNAFVEGFGRELTDYHKGNVKARLRMVAQYAVAGENNALVVGTDHGAESITGFFTKFGDGGADILPNFTLNKRQIRHILKELGVPEEIYTKQATADLLDNKPGQPDEYELGLTYDQIDDYLEGKTIDPEAANKLEKRYLTTRHKRTIPVTILDEWWRD